MSDRIKARYDIGLRHNHFIAAKLYARQGLRELIERLEKGEVEFEAGGYIDENGQPVLTHAAAVPNPMKQTLTKKHLDLWVEHEFEKDGNDAKGEHGREENERGEDQGPAVGRQRDD